MKCKVLVAFLFSGVLFFGCKKNDRGIVQKIDEHIIDSLLLDSLAKPYVGTYLINGTISHEWEQMAHSFFSTDTIENDTLVITRYDSTSFCLLMTFHPFDSTKVHNYTTEPLVPGTEKSSYAQGYIFPPDSNHYHNFNFAGPVYYYSVYQLSFPKKNIDSVYISQLAGYLTYNSYNTYLSGVKIH